MSNQDRARELLEKLICVAKTGMAWGINTGILTQALDAAEQRGAEGVQPQLALALGASEAKDVIIRINAHLVERAEAERDEALAAMHADEADVVLACAALRAERDRLLDLLKRVTDEPEIYAMPSELHRDIIAAPETP